MKTETSEIIEKNEGGRPTVFRQEYVEQTYKLCLLGATDQQLADFFNVAKSTINLWKQKQPKFLDALRRGKTIADAEVVHALYRRDTGYSHKAEKIFNNQGEIIRAEYIEHYPPDTGAAFIWLKNRQPTLWKDKVEIKQDVNLSVFPPKEVLDAIYAKALEEAAKRDQMLIGRHERLGIIIEANDGL